MKKIILLSLFLIEPASASTGFRGCSGLFFEGYSPIVSNQKLNKGVQDLCFSSFAVQYSPVSKTPLWSAEYTTPEILRQAKQIQRNDEFHEEQRIELKFRSLLSDYRGSGYDRGHLSPSASRPTRTDQYQSFSLSNIIPQAPKNNQEQWRHIEEAVRTLVTKNKEPAYVITGVLFNGSKLPRLGLGVLVPSHIYKVVYYPKSGLIGAYVSVNDNNALVDVVSVAQLQANVGIVFFPTLNGSNILNYRYALPLSANAAYKMSSFPIKSGESSIFDAMPSEEARPSPKKRDALRKVEDRAKKFRIDNSSISKELRKTVDIF